jgi:hypothetical protein
MDNPPFKNSKIHPLPDSELKQLYPLPPMWVRKNGCEVRLLWGAKKIKRDLD